MKKTLLISVCALLASTMSYAQVDTSTWKEGDDVTMDVGLGDCQNGEFSGETKAGNNDDLNWLDMGNYWKGSMPSEFVSAGSGAIGFYYDGATGSDLVIDIYQVVKIPAGWYTLQVQGLYREGTAVDTYKNHNSGNIMKNAWLYASVLEGEDPESKVINDFKDYIRSTATSGNTEKAYYTEGDGWQTGWRNDYSGKVNGFDDPVYCPTCLIGAQRYFDDGYYDQTKFDFAVTEDTYVRIGIRKTGNISQDWLVFTNLRLIYNGEVTDEIRIMLAEAELANATVMVEGIRDEIETLGFPALSSIVTDQTMEINDQVSDSPTYQELLDAIEDMKALYDTCTQTLFKANNLAELIEISEALLQVTDFDGKAEFGLAIEDIKDKATTDDVDVLLGMGGVDAYVNLFSDLAKARADYASTSPKGDRNDQDFTILIKYPWFVNTEYTPIQLTEEHRAMAIEQGIDNAEKHYPGTWSIQQNGDPSPWFHHRVKSGAADPSSVYGGSEPYVREEVASKVTLSNDETSINQWYKYMNKTVGWSGGLGLLYHGSLIGAGETSNTITAGSNEIRQLITGLPVGYYSLKALMRGTNSQGRDWDTEIEFHNIFAENSEGVRVASAKGRPDDYYTQSHPEKYSTSYGWSEWNSDVWQEHKTAILSVPDGKLLIGAQSTMAMVATGFRLSFYGTNPPVNEMAADEIEALKQLLADNPSITFVGDLAKINGIIESIKFPITSTDAYEEAYKMINDAKAYINLAAKAMAAYTLPADYATLAEEHPTAADMLEPAIKYIGALGTNAGDTYELIAEAQKVYDAYKSYLDYYENAMSIATPALKEEVAKERGELVAKYATVEQLNGYVTALNLLVNRAFIEVAGGLTATEAAPVEITGLVKNPDFNEKGRTDLAKFESINSSSVSNPADGWSGTSATANGCSQGNVEIWNNNPTSADFYQVLKGMPEGTYELHVRALYRDARNVADNNNASWTGWWIDANGDVEAWANHNAVLYASGSVTEEASSYIKSVCDGKFTEPSFVLYPKDFIEGDLSIEFDPDGNEIEVIHTDTAYLYYPGYVDPSTLAELPINPNTEAPYTHDESTAYPFDEKIEIEGQGTYYYPSSMYGAYCRFKLNPEAYCNSVRITIKRGEDLRIGIKKSEGFAGDWVIFDDFQLFYLGGLDDGNSITDVNVDNKANGAIYNIAGQKVNNAVKGIYIQNGKKVYVK